MASVASTAARLGLTRTSVELEFTDTSKVAPAALSDNKLHQLSRNQLKNWIDNKHILKAAHRLTEKQILDIFPFLGNHQKDFLELMTNQQLLGLLDLIHSDISLIEKHRATLTAIFTHSKVFWGKLCHQPIGLRHLIFLSFLEDKPLSQYALTRFQVIDLVKVAFKNPSLSFSNFIKSLNLEMAKAIVEELLDEPKVLIHFLKLLAPKALHQVIEVISPSLLEEWCIQDEILDAPSQLILKGLMEECHLGAFLTNWSRFLSRREKSLQAAHPALRSILPSPVGNLIVTVAKDWTAFQAFLEIFSEILKGMKKDAPAQSGVMFVEIVEALAKKVAPQNLPFTEEMKAFLQTSWGDFSGRNTDALEILKGLLHLFPALTPIAKSLFPEGIIEALELRIVDRAALEKECTSFLTTHPSAKLMWDILLYSCDRLKNGVEPTLVSLTAFEIFNLLRLPLEAQMVKLYLERMYYGGVSTPLWQTAANFFGGGLIVGYLFYGSPLVTGLTYTTQAIVSRLIPYVSASLMEQQPWDHDRYVTVNTGAKIFTYGFSTYLMWQFGLIGVRGFIGEALRAFLIERAKYAEHIP
jgi:hypothetical protein